MLGKMYWSRRFHCQNLIQTLTRGTALTFSLAHVAVSNLTVAGGTLAVVAALGVLTDLRTGAVRVALIDV